jgi:hypothetical protein
VARRFSSPSGKSRQREPEAELPQATLAVAHHLPIDTCRSEPHLIPSGEATDPGLAAVVDAWPELPEAICAKTVVIGKTDGRSRRARCCN